VVEQAIPEAGDTLFSEGGEKRSGKSSAKISGIIATRGRFPQNPEIAEEETRPDKAV